MLRLMSHFLEKKGDTVKVKKVQNLVQHFSEQFKNYYVPKKNVSIDESLICYEGRGLAIHNTCPINTITTSASNYFVYVKMKVKANKTQAVNMEFHMAFI